MYELANIIRDDFDYMQKKWGKSVIVNLVFAILAILAIAFFAWRADPNDEFAIRSFEQNNRVLAQENLEESAFIIEP